MQLSEFLAASRLTPEKFAEAIGVHRTSVVRFCNGTRRPDLGTIEKIHRATDGQVRAEDFFDAPVDDLGSQAPERADDEQKGAA